MLFLPPFLLPAAHRFGGLAAQPDDQSRPDDAQQQHRQRKGKQPVKIGDQCDGGRHEQHRHDDDEKIRRRFDLLRAEKAGEQRQ